MLHTMSMHHVHMTFHVRICVCFYVCEHRFCAAAGCPAVVGVMMISVVWTRKSSRARQRLAFGIFVLLSSLFMSTEGFSFP